MLEIKDDINRLNYDMLMHDKYNAFKIVKILRWQGYKTDSSAKEEELRFKTRKKEAIELLQKYNYSADEINDLLIATGFIESKVVKIPTGKTTKKEHKKRSKQVKEHVGFLHEHEHLKSWVCLAQIDYSMAEDGWAQYHYWNDEVADKAIDILYKNTSTYISVNEFRAPIRNALNIRYMTSFYADIDAHGEGIEVDIKAIKRYLNCKYKAGKLPKHSRITATGRGVQIYWKLEIVPDCLYWMWCSLEGYIVKELEDIKDYVEGHEVDSSCIDVARVLRLEGTANPKANGAIAHCIEKNDNVYRMTDILNNYFSDKIKVSKKKVEHDSLVDEDGRQIVLKNVNEQKAAIMRQRRIHDFRTLLELRKYQIQEGHREEFLWFYAWTWVQEITSETMIYKELSSVNAMFFDPVTDSEVRAIARKVFNKWSSRVLKQKAKDGSISSITGRYCFRNTTVIERLGITPAEREHFETIFWNKEEAERIAYSKRRNEKKRKDRRDENNMTNKERVALENSKAKLTLYKPYLDKGWGAKKIATELEMSVNTVKYDLKKIKERGLV